MTPHQKLKILFLSSWYPSKSIPTLGNFVQRHAEAVATVHDVHVLYISSLEDLNEDYSIDHSIINGVKTTIVYVKKKKPGARMRRMGFVKGIEWLKENGHFKFDLVHHNVIWPSGWQALWLKKKFNLPYIITEHWTGYDKTIRRDQPWLLGWLSKKVARSASAICPVTENLAGVMRNYGLEGNYHVIPNVVDTSIFHTVQKNESLIRFLHVSTLNDDHKNIRGILRVWKKFSDQNSNVHLDIGGDGPYEVYEKEAREMNISSIAFFGEKKWQEIAGMMQTHHCLLMFSNYENLPCVIVEAMASGMCVISTRVGGISEHLSTERGILIEARDEAQLLEALSNYNHNWKKFDGVAASQYARDSFSVEKICHQYSEVYREVLSQ